MKKELNSWSVVILIALSLLFLHCPFFAESSGIELLNDSEEGIDTWQEPVIVDEDSGMYPWETWVTYRAFGSPRQIWIKSNKIYTENGVLDPVDSRDPSGVKLCTNRNNRKDIYSSYSQYTGDNRKIMIQQLEP